MPDNIDTRDEALANFRALTSPVIGKRDVTINDVMVALRGLIDASRAAMEKKVTAEMREMKDDQERLFALVGRAIDMLENQNLRISALEGEHHNE
jgi:hypothetical protein